jgi:hypothetical protein
MEKGELLNLKFAYDHDYISSTIEWLSFSVIKYFRRIIIVFLDNNMVTQYGLMGLLKLSYYKIRTYLFQKRD